MAAAYVVLWVGGVVSNALWGRAPDDAAWAPPAFLALAATLALLGVDNPRRLLLVGAAGFAVEVVGAGTGFPFGDYRYTEVLAPRLFGVPLALGCAWLVLTAYVNERVSGLTAPAPAKVGFGALWLVAIDLLIDPLAAGPLGYWRWAGDGAYYGIPFSNFAGWFATGALLLAFLPGGRKSAGKAVGWTGLSVIVFFGLIAVAHKLALPALCAMALTATHFAAQRCSRWH